MNRKVLIADDEPNILLSLDFLLRKNGFDVLIARNGSEAVQLLNEHVPDVALLDIMMPDVDGYEICRLIKNTPKLNNCKVMFVSAKTKDTDIQKGYDAGADAYVKKPFSTRQIIIEIEKLLNR
jgi:DNA-binding response OmpR family regulator